MELAAIGGVVLIPAAAYYAFACVQLPHDAAHHRDNPAAGYFKHRVTVILVFIDNIFHGAFDLFQFCHPLTSCQIHNHM